MKYERLPYKAPGSVIEHVGTSIRPMDIPVFDRPIPLRENFQRVLNHEDPVWVPNALNDFNYALGGDLTGLSDLRFDFEERCDWVDLFGCTWEWIPSEGGSMLKPGQKPVVEDITEWESSVVWPDLNESRIKKCCEEVMARDTYFPEKMNYYDFGQGCTERLVALLGGYTEAMIALAEEPEACKELMSEISRFHVRMFDKISKYFPTDMIMYHDDWGTERDSFFSERTMDEVVFEPTEIFLKHVKETGVKIDFHSCGKIERFLPYYIALGSDFLQLQARCNDLVGYKEKYGDKIGFDVYILPITHEIIVNDARTYVDILGANGGLMSTIFGANNEEEEKMLWEGMYELNCYSREFYEKRKAEG